MTILSVFILLFAASYVHAGGPGPRADPKPPLNNPNNYLYLPNSKFSGQDLTSFTLSREDCAQKCDTQKGCTAFQMEGDNGCQLKQGQINWNSFDGKESSDAKYDFYYKNTIIRTYFERPGFDFKGNDISASNDTSNCPQLCDQTASCVAFVKTPTSCTLKSALPKSRFGSVLYQNKTSSIFEIKNDPAKTDLNSDWNNRQVKGQFEFDSWTKTFGLGIDDCKKQCQKTPGCLGFVNGGTLCFYYNVNQTTTARPAYGAYTRVFSLNTEKVY